MKFTREFKIGLVATIAVALTIWGINFLKGINILKPADRYYAVYGNVRGLIETAVVYVNGYKVGNVSGIEFDKKHTERLVVEISLTEKIRLPVNSTLVLRSASLISGTKDLDIILGEGPGFYEPGDTLRSLIQTELSDFIDPLRKQMTSLLASVDTVMGAVNKMIDQETRRNLQQTMANLNAATTSLRLSLQGDGSLSQSFNNLSSVTGNIKKNNEEISVILKNFAAVSDTLKQSDLKELIHQADETFSRTSVLFDQISKGEGTAGQLVTNDSLYMNLNNALASLDSLLIDLREHPKRYVHLSIFGKKDK